MTRRCERTLAECKARRAILDLADEADQIEADLAMEFSDLLPETSIGDRMRLALAAIYSDHPDYQPEWAR